MNNKDIALAYIDACARKKWDAVAPLLADDIKFVGTSNTVTGSTPYLAVLKRLGPVWERSDVRKVFEDGADVCVIYDFVTSTPAGSVPIVEWLRIENGHIRQINLFFDRVAFKPAADELARRSAA
jgi:hypothetical protein